LRDKDCKEKMLLAKIGRLYTKHSQTSWFRPGDEEEKLIGSYPILAAGGEKEINLRCEQETKFIGRPLRLEMPGSLLENLCKN